jgi:hypothetical protein
MKKILYGAVAALALTAVATPAAAQTNQRHYASTAFGGTTLTNPSGFGGAIAAGLFELAIANGIGTRYTANADAPSDTTPALTRIDVQFNLSGSVNRDCSFYSGNSSAAQNIDFGVIGVRTGNNENVNAAFEMVGPAVAEVETLTAGCNTNNVVEINKNDIRGLVNANPGGYDTNQFQANIPYRVEARWTGVALNAQTAGTAQTLNVPTTGNAGALQQGAWRSDMEIDFVAPAITDKGLVAGTYAGTTTLTLRAI